MRFSEINKVLNDAMFGNFLELSSSLIVSCTLIDSLSHAVNCFETLKRVKTRGNWLEIYTENISVETAMILSEISEIRKMFQSS